MPEPEDVVIQLLLALLYFVGGYITSDVFWPDQAFQYALIGLIRAMGGYLLLYAAGLHKPGPVVGVYIALAVSLITFRPNLANRQSDGPSVRSMASRFKLEA